MSIRRIQVQASKQNPAQVGFRGDAEHHHQQQQRPFIGQGSRYSGSGSKSTGDSNRPRRLHGSVIYDHLEYPHQPYAAATKLKSSDYRPRLCAEGPGDICTYSPVPCGRPAHPPNSTTYGKPNRTSQENGSGWPKTSCATSCDDKEWLERIYIPPKQHPAGKPGWNILPKYVKPRLPYGKNVGDILPRLRLRQADVIIRPCVGAHNVLRAGYVAFVENHESLELEAGTMLLRLAKSLGGFRMRECIKLFLRTVDGCWRFKGFLQTENVYNKSCNPSNYLRIPVRYQRTVEPNTADDRCIPQRGDIVIHEPWKDLTHTDRADKCSSLRWWVPTLEIDLNDVLVRMCVWVNDPEGTQLDGFVDLFMFHGIGVGWIFLGRDETVFEMVGLPPESDTSDDEKVKER